MIKLSKEKVKRNIDDFGDESTSGLLLPVLRSSIDPVRHNACHTLCLRELAHAMAPLSVPRSTSTIHHAHPPNHKKAHRPPPASLRYTHPVSQDTHLVSERLPVSGTGHVGRQGWADLRSQLRAWVHSRSLLV